MNENQYIILKTNIERFLKLIRGFHSIENQSKGLILLVFLIGFYYYNIDSENEKPIQWKNITKGVEKKLNKPTPEECFRSWTLEMNRKIKILMENGFTKDQAIELLKVYMLSDLESIVDAISNIG